MSDEEIEKAVKEEQDQTQTISFQRARENSIVYEALPEDYDAKQLDCKHPNDSVETMVNWLAGRAAATLGLSRVFVTGSPEDSNFRANQLMTRGAIVEFQKDMERICDWAFYQVMNHAKANLSVDYMQYVSWEWRGLDDLDENSHQDAIAKMLENNTATYKDILGNNWKEKLQQTKDEIQWFKDNNLAHPSYAMKSGGERTGADKTNEE